MATNWDMYDTLDAAASGQEGSYANDIMPFNDDC